MLERHHSHFPQLSLKNHHSVWLGFSTKREDINNANTFQNERKLIFIGKFQPACLCRVDTDIYFKKLKCFIYIFCLNPAAPRYVWCNTPKITGVLECGCKKGDGDGAIFKDTAICLIILILTKLSPGP